MGLTSPSRRSRAPRLVTKSYSLPLWKKGTFGIGSASVATNASEVFGEEGMGLSVGAQPPVPAETEHVTVKLSVPR